MERDSHKAWYSDIVRACPMLFNMVGHSMKETCMCFGFECNSGWKEPLAKLSYKLEALNMLYWPKYRVRIQAEQVKEKFGTLRFYHSVVVDPCRLVSAICKPFDFILKKLDKVSYGIKYVIDVAEWKEIEVTELSREEYVNEKVNNSFSSVTFKIQDGKYFKYNTVTHSQRGHYAPSKHKLLYSLNNRLKIAVNHLKYADFNEVAGQETIREYLDNEAYDLIHEAEIACENCCELCGEDISDGSYHKRCETVGWITYICDKCAEKKNVDYMKDGALWHGDREVKSAAEVKDDQKKIYDDMKKNLKMQEEKQMKLKEEIEKQLNEKTI